MMSGRLFRYPLIATAGMVMGSTAYAQQQPPVSQRYDLPSQSLATSIKAVAARTARDIVAPTSLLANRSAPELHGTFTAETALLALLAPSGLHLVSTGDTLIIAVADTAGAVAGTDAAADGDAAAIVVTGSHIPGARVASPVISITSDQMRNSGQTDLGQVVRAIPQSFGGGQNPGIGGNVPVASGGDVSGASSINLRGLGSDATLTLLNGHRLAYNASRQSIDVSAIPLGAVDRIEIVPDGASALYGSDAVAGVANIILKRDYDGINAGGRFAGTTDGGGFQQQYDLTAGDRWTGGGLLASYEYGNSAEILSEQRSYARPTARGLTLFPPLRHHSILVAGHQALNDHLTFAVDALFNVRRSHQDSPDNAQGDPDVGRQTFSTRDRSYGVAPSLRIDAAPGWRASVAGTVGGEKVDYTQVICAAGDCAETGAGYYRNSERSAEIDADGNLFALPAGLAKLAIGAGFRKIGFRRENGAGSSVNTAHAQSSYYAFGEIDLPLVGAGQGWPLVKEATLTGALRYERYPGVGEVITPKVGIIIAPLDDFDIKGSWGKSFRAPTLYQQYQPNAVYVYSPQALGAGNVPASATALLVFGGNRDLKPERATSWSATVDAHPRSLSGAHLAISYFNVHYRDRIVTPITFVSQALSNPVYRDQVLRDPSAADQRALIANAAAFANFAGVPYDPANVVAIVDDAAVNAGGQKAHGIDMLADYRLPIERDAELRLAVDVSYLVSSQQLSDSQPVTALAGTLFNPPHWRGRGTVSWASGPMTLTGDINYTGGVSDARQAPETRVDPLTSVDLTISYRVAEGHGALDGLGVIASVQNALNAKPQRIFVEGGYDTPYDSTNYSPLGRVLSVGITKTW